MKIKFRSLVLYLALSLCTLLGANDLIAQSSQNSWIYFNDKGTTNHIDSAVNKAYVDVLSRDGYRILGKSKWFNAVAVEGPVVGPLPYSFVKKTELMGRYKVTEETLHTPTSADTIAYELNDLPVSMLGLNEYHKRGYTGEGVVLALFDGGFIGVDTFEGFQEFRDAGLLKAKYDFEDDDTTVYESSIHGTAVMSMISGSIRDSFGGAAPGATMVLAKTEEVNREVHQEELNWVMALEWADSIGVDIIHSSLGYSRFDTLEGDYTYDDMDGETTIISKAAAIAVSKGIFVTNSAGNEGAKEWKYITAPCDGKGVLCVGAVDSFENPANFSSRGPSADGRVKPEVMAMGRNVYAIGNNGLIIKTNGTSLSGPLIAGMVACLKEAWPDRNNEQIFEAIIRSGNTYDNPSDSMGYGIPNVLIADSLLNTFVSIEEQELSTQNVRIYPNPADGQINIASTADLEQLIVMDLSGRIVLEEVVQGNQTSVDLGEEPNGLYLLRVAGNGWSVTRRIQIY